jgi:F420-non-reducing hydrogenase small subunit
MIDKPKLAIYWSASCGGCEIAILGIGDKILDVDEAFNIVFWPCVMDSKYKEVEAMPDGTIDLCLFNGSIRNSENEEMAHLLRRKSKTLVAFGSCAYEGCIPGLANLTTPQAIFNTAYLGNLSTDNPGAVVPRPVTKVSEGDLHIPEFYTTVRTLDQVVPVDYYIPGCPPESKQIWAVLETIIQGNPLPPRGSIVGACNAAVCDECNLKREEKKIKQFFRPHEIIPNPEECLLDQGLICMGPATRSGCGALCPNFGIRCEGCYGPPNDVIDQGAKMLSAIASVIDSNDPDEIDSILDTLVDPAGTFYRFGLAHSLLGRAKITA